MNKVIAILSEDDALKLRLKEFGAYMDSYRQRQAFILKQMKDLEETKRKAELVATTGVIERLKQLEKFPKAFDSKDQIHVDIDRDCVLWHRCDASCGHPNFVQVVIPNPPEGA